MLVQRNKLSLLVSAISALSAPLAFSQDNNDAVANLMEEEVVVTGFRQAVAAALDEKRNSNNSMESIVAEDIGKMPDLNLAESLQRSPGVAITREGGEGRQITVRGLGPEYTRVTLNGMEVPSSAGGTDASGGTNRGRPFDFNVFGSELFSRINIYKSATASVEEGGLASSVALFSHKPLDKPGLTLTGAAQGGYNVNTGKFNPRLSGLYAQTFMDDTLGLLAAFNYSDREVRQDGFGTVRWVSPAADSSSAYIEPAGGTDVNGTLADGFTINDLYTPRLPRMDLFNRDTERLGIALGAQYRPTDSLEFGVNVLRSEFEQNTTSLNYFAQFRGQFNNITANSIDVSNNGRFVVGGDFDGVVQRSESRLQEGKSEFTQIVADFKYDINDSMTLTGMLGNAVASYKEDYFRNNFDAIAADQSFSFRLTDGGNLAEMDYGFDITSAANHEYFDTRLQRDDLERDYTTLRVDYQWDFDDEGSNIRAGFINNSRTIASDFFRSDFDKPNDDNVLDPNEVEITLDSSNTTTVEQAFGDFGDSVGAPSGFPSNWLIADFGGLFRDLGSPSPEFLETSSNTYEITEDTTGIYAEVNWVYDKLQVNAGVRYVETDVTASGFFTDANNNIVFQDQEGSYNNTLPALNLTYNFMEDLRGRISWSENVARPEPSSLSGSVTVASTNSQITASNPALEPEIAESLDLAVEWFFAEESYVGLTLFQKDISDSIQPITRTVTGGVPAEYRAAVDADPAYQGNIDPNAGDRDNGEWTILTSGNSDEVLEIDGWEVGYQQLLPMGFGVLANYTNVDSGDLIVPGLSEETLNLGGFWENDEFSVRLVMNTRDDYVSRNPGRQGNQQELITGPTRFDVSAAWNATESLSVTLEIINLTDEKERRYVNGPDGDLDLVYEYNTTGTELFLGARYKF